MAKPKRVIDLVPYQEAGAMVYQPQRELANCRWCRWSRSNTYGPAHSCVHPSYVHRSYGPFSRVGRCADWNRNGACVHYSLSLFTRFLRAIGLRKPAIGDPPKE